MESPRFSSSPLASLTPALAYALLAVSIGPLLFGFHMSELNAPRQVLTCENLPPPPPGDGLGASLDATLTFLPECIPMGPAQFGIVTSAFTIGGFVGATSASTVAARAGRVRTLLYGSVLGAAGSLLEAISAGVLSLSAGRVLAGLAAGLALVVSPVHLAEIVPPSDRGFYGSLTQIMVNVGIFLAQLLGLFFSTTTGWRTILLVPAVLAAVNGAMLAGLLKRPARPRATTEGDDTASGAAHGERAGLMETHDGFAETATFSDRPAVGMLQVAVHPQTRPAIVAVVLVMMAQQFSGINAIIMYGVSLLSTLLASSSALLNVLISVLNIVVTSAAAPLPDRLGRKRCLQYSIAGMGVSALALALGILHTAKAVSVVAVVGFVSSFAVGLGPVPFMLASELVPEAAVDAAQSWSLAVNWASTFVVAQFFPILADWLGNGQVFFVFAAAAAVFSVLISKKVPETVKPGRPAGAVPV